MAITKPYYPPHQISPGKYTPGGEFVLPDGAEYIGPYHILQNGWVYTEFKPSVNGKRLYPLNVTLSEDVRQYNRIKQMNVSQYMSPIPYTVIPTMEDYVRGEIYRYFVQKRNNPSRTIIEIDLPQYMSINTKGLPGINGVMYNSLVVPWVISKVEKQSAYQVNLQKIIKAESDFIGIGLYLRDATEFYK